jgi:two-component system cell cycle sensor histidine kinase/response regulator CckA
VEGLTGVIVHLVDITERRQLELQFAQSQRLQAIGQLSGGIAHDFNNLLTVVLGFCDLLLSRHGQADPSYDDIVQIRSNAARGSMLVRQLLAFSKHHPGKPVNLNVCQALRDLSGMLKRLLGEHIELTLDVSAEPMFVLIDPGQFDQIVINLAVNARDAMKNGGSLQIRVSGSEFSGPVVRGGETVYAGKYARLDFIDNGAGIPKEILSDIFEPFFTTKEDCGGTGLGLATVYGVLKQRSGFVFVESAQGVGTRFEVLMPIVENLDDYEEHRPTIHDIPPTVDRDMRLRRDHCTVLLVEDEDAVRLLAARGLRNKGFTVIEAPSGDKALVELKESDGNIDVIISDIIMPGTDGISVVRAARDAFPRIQAILTSGYSDDLLVSEFKGDPNVRFLAKPFTLAELTETACKMLDLAKAP